MVRSSEIGDCTMLFLFTSARTMKRNSQRNFSFITRVRDKDCVINYFESPFIQLAVHSKVGNVVLLLDVPLLFISFGVSVFILALVKIHPGFNDELDVVCRQAVDACLSHFFRNLLGQDIKVDVDEAVSVGLALEDVARCKRVDCCINDLLEVCIGTEGAHGRGHLCSDVAYGLCVFIGVADEFFVKNCHGSLSRFFIRGIAQ